MALALGVAVALAQYLLVGWLDLRFPKPSAWIGTFFGFVVTWIVVAVLRNPYLGEIHSAFPVALVFLAVYLGLSGLLRGAPAWRSLGIALFDLAWLVPVLTVVSNLRDRIGHDLHAMSMSQGEQWVDSCDAFTSSFSLSWLVVTLLGAAGSRWVALRGRRHSA